MCQGHSLGLWLKNACPARVQRCAVPFHGSGASAPSACRVAPTRAVLGGWLRLEQPLAGSRLGQPFAGGPAFGKIGPKRKRASDHRKRKRPG